MSSKSRLAAAYAQAEQVGAILVLLQSYTERVLGDNDACVDDYACTVGHALAAARTLADCVAEELQAAEAEKEGEAQ